MLKLRAFNSITKRWRWVDVPTNGSISPVSCVLVRNANVNIHSVDDYPLNWDLVWDNLSDQNPILALPTGIGFTVAIDGSDGTITTTVSGVWAFTFNSDVPQDVTWAGYTQLAGISLQQVISPSAGIGIHDMFTAIVSLPSGASVIPILSTSVQSTAGTLNAKGKLAVTRLA